MNMYPPDNNAYNQKVLTNDQFIDKLIDKGLTIKDRPAAMRFLRGHNKFSLEIYFDHYRQADGIFIPGSEFRYVIDLYNFNSNLCYEIFPMTQEIEVFTKGVLEDHIASSPLINGNPFIHVNQDLYIENSQYGKLEDIFQKIADRKSRNKGIEPKFNQYRKKFPDEDVAFPIDMISNYFMQGDLSLFYENLIDDHKLALAKYFNINCPAQEDKVLENWLITVRNIRNICAHPDHFFNRYFPNPILLDRDNSATDINNDRKVGNALYLLFHILGKIPDQEELLTSKLKSINKLIRTEDERQQKKAVYVNIPEIMGYVLDQEYTKE